MLDHWDTDKSVFAWVLAAAAKRLGKKRLKKLARDLDMGRKELRYSLKDAKRIARYHDYHRPVEEPQPVEYLVRDMDEYDVEFFAIVEVATRDLFNMTGNAFEHMLVNRITTEPDRVEIMNYGIIDHADRKLFFEVSCMLVPGGEMPSRASIKESVLAPPLCGDAARQDDKIEAPDGTSSPQQGNEDAGG